MGRTCRHTMTGPGREGPAVELSPQPTAKRKLAVILLLFLVFLGGAGITYALMRTSTAQPIAINVPNVKGNILPTSLDTLDRPPVTFDAANKSTATGTAQKSKPLTLGDLFTMTPKEIEKADIAEMNLLCAVDLNGSEKLDVGKALARLNDWAERVRYWTDKSMWDFRKNPGKFKNSEAQFRVLLLISVLQQDFGVHYNDRGESNCDFTNSKNAFIHGMIDDQNGGTCASMAVMYVAVGRRLGYPLKLVLAKTHIFARYDDSKTGDRFNLEGTNPRFDDHPDSYYCKWPEPISDDELKTTWYLKSLTPQEELAVFLQNRASCLIDNGRFTEAKTAFEISSRLAPHDPLGKNNIAYARYMIEEYGVPTNHRNMRMLIQPNASLGFNEKSREKARRTQNMSQYMPPNVVPSNSQSSPP